MLHTPAAGGIKGRLHLAFLISDTAVAQSSRNYNFHFLSLTVSDTNIAQAFAFMKPF